MSKVSRKRQSNFQFALGRCKIIMHCDFFKHLMHRAYREKKNFGIYALCVYLAVTTKVTKSICVLSVIEVVKYNRQLFLYHFI